MKSQYDQIQTSELNEAINSLVEQFPQLAGREIRLRTILTKLQHSSASNTRAYELLGLRDTEKLSQLWGVSMRRVTAHCQTLHERWGVGRKFGKTWVLTADEAERHRPAAKAGRPKANASAWQLAEMNTTQPPAPSPSEIIKENKCIRSHQFGAMV